MVLFGINNNFGTTVILFNNPFINTDKNVYGLTQISGLYPTQQKLDIQVIGNKEIKLKTILNVSATILEVRNNFLNLAIFVVDDYSVFNTSTFSNQLGLSLYNKSEIENRTNANLEWVEDKRFSSNNVQIVNSNKLPDNFLVQTVPIARIISIDQSYNYAYNNGLLYLGDQVCGIVIHGMDSRTYCIHSYYVVPYLNKVLSFMNKFLQNSIVKIASLTRINIMESIRDDITPTVCDMGISYIQVVRENNKSDFKNGVYVDSILKYLNLSVFPYDLEMSAIYRGGYPLINLANSSAHFTQKFYENELNTRFIITRVQYTDIMTGELSTIDWNSGDIINNNFDDYAFRGDPEMAVIIEYIIEQDKQDDCAVKFVKESLQLTPLPTSETINGRTFSRSSAQIPGIYQYTQVERWIANDRSIDGMPNSRMFTTDNIADGRSGIFDSTWYTPNPYPNPNQSSARINNIPSSYSVRPNRGVRFNNKREMNWQTQVAFINGWKPPFTS
jgi:hypothetical protein